MTPASVVAVLIRQFWATGERNTLLGRILQGLLDLIQGMVVEGGIPHQEPIASENVAEVDTPLAAMLSTAPLSPAGVLLFLNGQMCVQGPGNDYTVAGQTLTWLAGTGTAVPLRQTTDRLVVWYLAAT